MAETDATTAPADSPADGQQQAAPALTGAELEKAIRHQVEHYFSKENLARDHYLLSLMDGQRFVPIDLIANFSRVKQLSTDVEVIARAIEGSVVCALDESRTKIKPSVKAAQRTTIILRDTPEGTTLEEVQALWKDSEFKGVTDIRPDIAGCWFVSMETEEEARDAVMWVRQQKLGGEQVKARIKTESITPSVFFAPPPQVVYAPAPIGGAYAMGAWSGDGRYVGEDRQGMGERQGDGRRRTGERGRKGGKSGAMGSGGNGMVGADGYKKGQREGGGRNKRSGRKHGAQGASTPPKKAQEFKLGSTHFPPLPKKQGGENPGYSGDFQKYKKMDFISVIKGTQVEKPDLPELPVVQSEANDTIESGAVPEAAADAASSEQASADAGAGASSVSADGGAEQKSDAVESAPTAVAEASNATASGGEGKASQGDESAPSAPAEAAPASGSPQPQAQPAKQTWAQKLASSK
eukprot:TRINITY_DN238_c0_g2_i1.p1 TRINITY_DN238_c0_g2~~TRINITY_DN238_c0_g2_i1.p1  ORF type:complete len:466 (-),score=119.63 TRINITY_DN238_c0_g2_i1:646-2043(-)